MREQLIHDIDILFAGAANTGDIKQEILQNTLDRYDDLISQGKTPEAAYSLAIAGIGDISEILELSANSISNTSAYTAKNRLARIIRLVLFITGITIYLFVSFVSGYWHITWLIILITMAACGLAKAIIDLKEAG